MQKTVLERFIAKYNLGGAAEAVTWKNEKKQLKTKFITDDKNCLGIVGTSEFSIEDGEYSIYDTAQLRSILSVLDEDIQVKVNKKSNGDPISLGIRDAATKATFILSDPSVIPPTPDLKTIPDFELEMALDTKFINRFVKGKNALPEVETFTIVCDKKPQIIIGYSDTMNTNRVAFDVEFSDSSEMIDRNISFSARYMKELLLANKEARGGTMKVSKAGFSHITFDVDGFNVDYYLVEVKTK